MVELAPRKVVLIKTTPAAEIQQAERNFMVISFIDGSKTEVYRMGDGSTIPGLL
jgi:hypothetical protein